jgi:hypothetical protein
MKYGTLNPDNLCRVLEGILSERDNGTAIKVSVSSEKVAESCMEGEENAGEGRDCCYNITVQPETEL